MKKEIYLFLILVLFILILSSSQIVSARSIIGKWIWGEATSGVTNVSILVLPPTAPELTILLPLNQTYLRNTSLPLNFSSNGEQFWYNINHTTNLTITENITFSASQGSHTLFLYANGTGGLTSRDISFDANSSRIVINYAEYNGSTRGSSTDFYNDFTYEQLANISNMILENNITGKILFLELINLTDDEIPNDDLVDLDAHTNISQNRIEINATAMPNLNGSAILVLYGLSLINPRVLVNGVVCSDSVCTEITYNSSNGTYIFNVTSTSSYVVYTAGETPTGGPGPEEPPGGGGGGGVPPTACEEDWSCGEWSGCYNSSIYDNSSYIFELCRASNLSDEKCGYRIKLCVDVNECGTEENKPGTLEVCDISIEPPEPVKPPTLPTRLPSKCGDLVCAPSEFFSCLKDCWISWVALGIIAWVAFELLWMYKHRKEKEERNKALREKISRSVKRIWRKKKSKKQ